MPWTRFTIVVAAACTAWMVGSGCALSPETIRRIEGEPGQEGTGIMFTKLPQAIKILATYEATDDQRQRVAERARMIQKAPHRDSAGRSRYLAVETEPDDRSQGAASVMLWDTQTEEIVGNEVYDIETRPNLGQVALWQTYTAEYVGTGQAL